MPQSDVAQEHLACVREDNLDELRGKARRALQQAIDFSFSCQQPDGHWVAPVSADATFTAQYVMFKYAMPGMSLDDDGRALQRWLLGTQNPNDGSWALAPDLPGNLSTSVEAYLALRLLGTPASDPALQRARGFVLAHGGAAKVRFFTRFFLATFGLFPWSAIPQMPAELVLMPAWAPLNIYVLSSWARSTLIPILVVRHHEPVYALPNGRCSPENDFLDELWLDPTSKEVPFAPPLWELFSGPDRDLIKLAFTLGDKALVRLGGLKKGPQRRLAIRRCIEWLLEHQEEAGDWAGFFPPMHGSVWALLLEGFPLNHQAVRLGLEALERLAVNDASGKWLQSTVSPCWDTALMIKALCDGGLNRDNARVAAGADWVRALQLMGPQGDWRVYSPNQQAGGWSFEYHNTWYPDVDDTAVVIMMLVAQDPADIESECVESGVEWILGMQNRDGGWGAFDINNDSRWLHKIPFSDMDSLVDPSTADVTGRMLECFGLLLTHRKGGHRLRAGLTRRVRAAAQKGLAFLLKEQHPSGSWWGRWGCNYNYGTTNVLRGLPAFCGQDKKSKVYRAAMRAILWLEACQNDDGGWGETLLSYTDANLAGRGPSTAAHTAWALDSLLRFRPPTYAALQKGVAWLIANQNPKTEERNHWSSWPTNLYVGTGFPNVLYLGYPFYHHHFPISALSRFLDISSHYQTLAQDNKAADQQQEVPVPSLHVVTTLHRPDILLMVLGSRGDIDVFLSIAERLRQKGCRVRIATHPYHRAVVDAHDFDFYDAGGSPDEFARLLGEESNLLWSILRGDLARLRRSLCLTFARFWQAGFNNSSDYSFTKQFSAAATAATAAPPFLADVVVSIPATTVHVHVVEKLHIPLVLVSAQPTLPTLDFPHVFTMTKPSFSPGRWCNYASYFCLNLLNWLALGSFINGLRVTKYRMRPMCWVWATRDFVQAKIPQVCLWSSHMLPTPAEWDKQSVVIAGYTTLDHGNAFTPHDSLSAFLETDKSVIAVSFGSMNIPDPAKLISTLSSAAARIQAKVVICRSWPAKMEMAQGMPVPPPHVYLTDAIPHGWLLPRVDGFVHHGGAGHMAAGLRAGVPMLVLPFFLDQHFWAAKVYKLGLGPPPPLELMRAGGLLLPTKTKELAQSLGDLLSGRYRGRCTEMATRVRAEGDGADVAAGVIERQLEMSQLKSASCVIVPSLKAQWLHSESGLALSGAAAASLVASGILGWDDVDAQSRVDWAARWRDQTPKSRLHVLCYVTSWLGPVVGIILAIYALFLGPPGDAAGMELPDPVKQARIRRSMYDLEFIRRSTGDKEAVSLDERFAQRWSSAAAAEFHGRFVADGTSRAS